MAFKLDDYQSIFISEIWREVKIHNTLIAQLGTGGGKTVCFANIGYTHTRDTNDDVLVLCDSDDILFQTRRTFLEWYGIDTDVIDSKSSSIQRSSLFGNAPRIFVAMVETFNNRAKKESFMHHLRNVGLVIVDECHMGNFIKIYEHFPFAMRIGFTATPKSSDKKKPLNKYHNAIVCGPTIRELIEYNRLNPTRGVVEDVTYCLSGNINREEIEQEQIQLGYKGEDFNADLTGKKLSNPIQIQNTIDAYIKHAPGKRTICFNANVTHSKAVTKAMNDAGLNARHMDADCSDEYKKDCKKWLRETSNAILCNVGMTTKGFDQKDIECIILNRLTKSLPLYNQMCGRGGRPWQYPEGHYKENFIVLDMCDNVLGGGHGRWSDFIDWRYIFENPSKPRHGVAPVKLCPECDYVNAASARVCKGKIENFFDNDGSWMDCGYEFAVTEKFEDTTERTMVLVSKNIDVEKIITYPKFQGRSEYFTLFETIRSCVYYAKDNGLPEIITQLEYDTLWDTTYRKIIEWQTIKGRLEDGKKKKNTKWYTDTGKSTMNKYLTEYGFKLELNGEIEVTES